MSDVPPDLARLRSSIDNIDAALVHLLAERFKATQRVGILKAKHQLPPGDPNRELAQIQRLRALAESAHLDPAFAEKWFNFVVAEVIHHHERLAGHDAVRESLAIPAGRRIVGVVALGHEAVRVSGSARTRHRRGVDEVLHVGRFGASGEPPVPGA